MRIYTMRLSCLLSAAQVEMVPLPFPGTITGLELIPGLLGTTLAHITVSTSAGEPPWDLLAMVYDSYTPFDILNCTYREDSR